MNRSFSLTTTHTLVDYLRGVLSFICLLFLVTIHTHQYAHQAKNHDKPHKVTVLIFSKDRPLQLAALLDSFTQKVTGSYTSTILYYTSNPEFDKGYSLLLKQYPTITWLKQVDKNSFKKLTLEVLKKAGTYILFGVDDIILRDYINLSECINLLEITKAYGFYFRLGAHITEQYTTTTGKNMIVGRPPFTSINDTVITWQFKQGQGDWRYPNTLDMTLYRTKDILKSFEHYSYTDPNSLEGWWSSFPDLNRYGLCYKTAKIINLPLNQVNQRKTNRAMNTITTQELLKKFLEGYKLDITDLPSLENHRAPHVEYIPRLLKIATCTQEPTKKSTHEKFSHYN